MANTRRPDQVDVARHAGVSLGSVSTAINRPDMVSEKMRQRVQKSIDELGYIPNRSAATLKRGGASRVFGLLLPEITNAFYAAIADAVVDGADKHGYAVSLCVSHEDPARERRHFDLLAQQRAAGAIVAPISPEEERLATLRAVGTHVVLVDRLVDLAVGCSVAVDDVLGGRLAVSHLLHGADDGVTVVNGPQTIRQCRDRWLGAVAAFEASGRPRTGLAEFTVETMSEGAGEAVIQDIIRSGAPRNIFCINDQLAVGVMKGLSQSGIIVPDGARVVGYGDLDIGQSLSSIGQPKSELGGHAVELLLDELSRGSDHVHSNKVFLPHLVERGSSAVRPPVC